MEYYSHADNALKAYNKYREQAFEFVRSKVVKHFEGDNWTNEQIEAVIGRPIDAEWLDNSKPLEEKISDEITINDEVNEGNFSLIALVETAKSFYLDLNGLNMPYMITEETKDGEQRFTVCIGRKDLALAWEHGNYVQDCPFYVIKGEEYEGESIIEGKPNMYDLDKILELPRYDGEPAYNRYDLLAERLADTLDKNFASFVCADNKTNSFLVFHKDPSLDNVYEIWVKKNCIDDRSNGGTIVGKVFDLCGKEELSLALKEIEEGQACISTGKGKRTLSEIVADEVVKELD